MHVLAIDVGSYSVKYISTFLDRRKISYVEMSEIIVRDYMADRPDVTFIDAQMSIVKEILDSTARADSRIIYQAPNDMMTTRFLTLPVKSKKKAELMLPFQLEEDIPYALSEIHFSYRMEGQKTQHSAIVELIRTSTFEPYYSLLRDKDILPTVLTTEASAMENYFNQNAVAGPFCVINLGHKTTKAYFFYNSRLLVTHTSYVGGHDINEMIAQTYKIDTDEAILYKHQNAFVLTSSLQEEVEASQRDFGLAMDKVLVPLISDFSRWKVGFKVNFGLTLGNVFICGGTSNIKNLPVYLSEKWETKVVLLESFEKVEAEKIDLNPKLKSRFAISNMMAQGFRRKNRFINLLTGKFAQASAAEFPLHSYGFIGIRVAAISAIFVISLMVERYFIEQDIQFMNTRLTNVMKNEVLEINPRLRRTLISSPQPILDGLTKRGRGIKQEISTLQSAIDIQALSPLVALSQIAARSTATTLIEFNSSDAGDIAAVFSSEELAPLQSLRSLLTNSQFKDVKAVVDEQKLTLSLTASGI